MQARLTDGRDASSSVGIINCQLVKTAESGGRLEFVAGTKVKGRKRRILTDTGGLLSAAIVYSADIQDRDTAMPVLASIRESYHCYVMTSPTAAMPEKTQQGSDI